MEMQNDLPESAVAVLNNGNSAIVVDDGCYCVKNRTEKGWGLSAWVFPEALQVMKGLPDDPRAASLI